MGIQIRLEGLDEVIGKLNRMANGANSGLQKGLMQGGGNSTEARMVRYAEYSNLLDNMIDELVDTKREIMKLIKMVEDARYQELLILRYIEFNSWNDIANKMGYEYRHVLRLHGMALIEAKKIRERLAL